MQKICSKICRIAAEICSSSFYNYKVYIQKCRTSAAEVYTLHILHLYELPTLLMTLSCFAPAQSRSWVVVSALTHYVNLMGLFKTPIGKQWQSPCN